MSPCCPASSSRTLRGLRRCRGMQSAGGGRRQEGSGKRAQARCTAPLGPHGHCAAGRGAVWEEVPSGRRCRLGGGAAWAQPRAAAGARKLKGRGLRHAVVCLERAHTVCCWTIWTCMSPSSVPAPCLALRTRLKALSGP
eukprot:363756-Chlamydomonas_euryale.AAC.5